MDAIAQLALTRKLIIDGRGFLESDPVLALHALSFLILGLTRVERAVFASEEDVERLPSVEGAMVFPLCVGTTRLARLGPGLGAVAKTDDMEDGVTRVEQPREHLLKFAMSGGKIFLFDGMCANIEQRLLGYLTVAAEIAARRGDEDILPSHELQLVSRLQVWPSQDYRADHTTIGDRTLAGWPPAKQNSTRAN